MIPERWYPVLESRRLGRRPVGLRRMGRDLVLWRGPDGAPVAQPSACPHRGASLAQGRVVDGELQCPWHGFRFDAHGACTRMPCEGRDARIPRAMHTRSFPVREERGLVWLWWGDARAVATEIPYFDGLDERGTSQASRVLPYHYSRMMETNLDLHHTPFVHGSVVPGTGTHVVGFEAHADGDRVRGHGEMRREGKARGLAFRVEALLPCLVQIQLTPRVKIVVASTPIDDGHTWMWFRYYQDYTRLPGLSSLLTWIAVQAELRIVQPQDWRVFAGLPPGTIDDVDAHYVHADLAIALYRKRRRALLDASAPAPALPNVRTV